MNKMRKFVITAAGKGNRLLPLTKETPKEMLPIYSKSSKGEPILKPILHVIFDSAFDAGYRDFCFIVGRGKRSIEDHFLVSEDEKNEFIKNNEMQEFFSKLKKCNITYVQQSTPRGFGDAVMKTKSFVGQDYFLLHAGDDAILSNRSTHLKRLEKAFFKQKAKIAFFVTRMEDPRNYGVIEGKEIEKNIFKVSNFQEKPKKPKSNLATIGIYLFHPSIFDILTKIRPDKKGEIQLADALKKAIQLNQKTIAVELTVNEKRVDVGTPENYVECLGDSYLFYNKR